MTNSPRFYFFSYTPKKLIEERVSVQTNFSDAEKSVMKKRSKMNLPKLLEKIRQASYEQLHELIGTLTRIDILLLIYEYPFPEETAETKQKINEILNQKYTPLVGKTVWMLFQQEVKDYYLQDLIKKAYWREKDTFLQIEDEFLQPMGKAFSQSGDLIYGLADELCKSKHQTKRILMKWKVKEGSVLEERLVYHMLEEGIGNDFIFKRDGTEEIINIMNRYSMNDYKTLMKLYIEARNHKEFHHTIMQEAINRLHNPNERMDDWIFLSEKGLEQVKRWLMANELKKFFDNDTNSKRFDYWKRYIDYMEKVIPLKFPLVAFIYFKNFVVVEFGNMGAAYFYHREGFEKFIYPLINNYRFTNSRSASTREGMLKDTNPQSGEIGLFITKLSHIPSNGWQRKFDREMIQLLQKYK